MAIVKRVGLKVGGPEDDALAFTRKAQPAQEREFNAGMLLPDRNVGSDFDDDMFSAPEKPREAAKTVNPFPWISEERKEAPKKKKTMFDDDTEIIDFDIF
jgi:hypothetical protein